MLDPTAGGHFSFQGIRGKRSQIVAVLSAKIYIGVRNPGSVKTRYHRLDQAGVVHRNAKKKLAHGSKKVRHPWPMPTAVFISTHIPGERQLSGGSVVVVHEEPHPQMTGTLSYRPEETGGRQREKSLDTRHRRLDDRYRVLPWPEDCTVVVCLHDALYNESRFSLSSDSHRILIWRERGSRNHPSNIIERDRYGGRGVLVWGGIVLGSRTDLHIFDAGSVNGTRYCNEILLPYVRLFRGAMGLQFLFMDDNAPCHHTVAAEQLLESEDIERMDWPARSPDLNPIDHVWDFLGRRLAARTLPPVTIREFRLALQDEWAAMPQQLIDTLILSMGRRCETCLAVRGDHIPY
ncbi:transposable element Tcb2 transposase [Trichonephila clavipes]|uniref:Transposable element Tcb2 transposase n=1 Tax=Trichonephila clavipes TaxID=2585209 RepID=A0A8X6VKA8_TRICX|nr:transposable element Tcb2 transposase [Trichonephila clavipes]